MMEEPVLTQWWHWLVAFGLIYVEPKELTHSSLCLVPVLEAEVAAHEATEKERGRLSGVYQTFTDDVAMALYPDGWLSGKSHEEIVACLKRRLASAGSEDS